MFGQLALLVAASSAVQPEIEVAADVACPGEKTIARAISAVVAGRKGEGMPSRIVVESAGAARLRLRLFDPGGRTAIDRLVDVDTGHCETTARAIALRDRPPGAGGGLVFGRARDAAGAPAPAAAAHRDRQGSSARGPFPRAIQRGRTGSQAAAPAAPARRTLVLEPPPGQGERIIGAARPGVRSDSTGVGWILPGVVTREALPDGGQAQLESTAFLLRALAEKAVSDSVILAGLEAVLGAERGESRGIGLPGAGRRLQLAMGGSLGLAWLATSRLRVALEATGARILLGRDFAVTGYGLVLAAPAWQGVVALRLGWALMP